MNKSTTGRVICGTGSIGKDHAHAIWVSRKLRDAGAWNGQDEIIINNPSQLCADMQLGTVSVNDLESGEHYEIQETHEPMPEETPEARAAFYAEQDAASVAAQDRQDDAASAAHEASIAADGIYRSPKLAATLGASCHYCRVMNGVVVNGWYDIPSGKLEMGNPDAGNFRNGETIAQLHDASYRKQAADDYDYD